ncbi:retron-type reverse transcriptase [Rhizobium laguerreae]|uniref:RNA-directed DNA polymerase n=1 Tax=Rhizobium laguerreae TaxID=1076926 RepID=A0ABR6G501_9HYPH|nr:reverse transcriptase domain-containing protein [Rhizobium laguerreae]MBB3161339.1 retron-type reverse transcriptase [Rhizobium laguerreae]OOO51721.1 hypothetical protein BS630_04785 [Rhizobium laguerreae]
MPPRSYYNAPRPSDYVAFATAFFPEDSDNAGKFADQFGLPYLESTRHLAGYLGIAPSLIRQIIHRPAYHFREFKLTKSTGEERLISTPKTYLKVIQWWIADNILDKIDLSDNVHGFRKNRSYISNAIIHRDSRHILNVDVKSFFSNIKIDNIFNVFSALGYGDAGSLLLSTLTSKDGMAPTGAPTSPMIANAVFRDIDTQLSKFSQQMGLLYTRYADDLTFSSMEWIEHDVLEAVSQIVESGGFNLNSAKTKFMGPGDRKEVTGVTVNAGLNTSKEWRNSVRGYLHRAFSNPADYIADAAKVRGIYGILLQFDPTKAKRLTQTAEQTMLRLLKAQRDSASS